MQYRDPGIYWCNVGQSHDYIKIFVIFKAVYTYGLLASSLPGRGETYYETPCTDGITQ